MRDNMETATFNAIVHSPFAVNLHYNENNQAGYYCLIRMHVRTHARTRADALTRPLNRTQRRLVEFVLSQRKQSEQVEWAEIKKQPKVT